MTADQSPPTSDDKHCPACGNAEYWLYEIEKECRSCGTTWISAWSLAHNDPDEGTPGS